MTFLFSTLDHRFLFFHLCLVGQSKNISRQVSSLVSSYFVAQRLLACTPLSHRPFERIVVIVPCLSPCSLVDHPVFSVSLSMSNRQPISINQHRPYVHVYNSDEQQRNC